MYDIIYRYVSIWCYRAVCSYRGNEGERGDDHQPWPFGGGGGHFVRVVTCASLCELGREGKGPVTGFLCKLAATAVAGAVTRSSCADTHGDRAASTHGYGFGARDLGAHAPPGTRV